MLLAITLNTRELKKNNSRHKVWSNIFSLFSATLVTEPYERKYSSKQCILPFLLFHSVLLLQPLLYPGLVLQPSPALCLVLALGSAASISALHKPSSSFLVFMIINILAGWQAEQLVVLLSPHIPAPYCSADTVLLVCQVGYLLPAVLLRRGEAVQAELQAFFWEDLSLRIILRGGAVTLTPLLIGSLGLFSLCCLSLKYKSSRTWVSLCLAILLLVLSTTRQGRAERVSKLSWSEYQAVCLTDKLTAGEQATCHHFTGLVVEWAGVVDRVRIVQRRNYMEQMLSFLPEEVRRKTDIKCLLGDEFRSCDQKSSSVARLLCTTRTQSELEREERCHLEAYAEYEYQVVLVMPVPLFGTSRTVVLAAGDLLRNTVINIKEGQRVRAVGKLVSGTGREEVLLAVRDIVEDIPR